jgi:4-carboxymuconolactone decarboxylase
MPKSLPKKSSPKKSSPKRRPAPRLAVPEESSMNTAQRALMDAIRSGPRGKAVTPRGPFAVWLHAPEFGQLGQALGGHLRYLTGVPPRLSEFAILCTARLWRAQYEWFAHEPPALAAGVKPKTVADLRAGRIPKSAPKDERAVYDFIQELYKKRRVGDRNYKRVQDILGEAATVELVGILGYYVMISMTLNVFQMLPPLDARLAFPEPK